MIHALISSDVDSNLLSPDHPGLKLLIEIDRRPSVRPSVCALETFFFSERFFFPEK